MKLNSGVYFDLPFFLDLSYLRPKQFFLNLIGYMISSPKYLYLVLFLLITHLGITSEANAQKIESLTPDYVLASLSPSPNQQSTSSDYLTLKHQMVYDIDFEIEETKSKTLAGFYSFLLPGLGEAYAGDFSSGKYSLGIEIALVSGLISTVVYANSLESDYQILARNSASVSSGQKSEQFWKDISNYSSWENFNNERLKDRNYDGMYSKNNYWSWESEEQRKDYRSKRISSDQAFQSAYYFIAAMGLNRLISIINAVRSTAEFNNNLTKNLKLHVTPLMALNRKYIMNGLKISFHKTF